MFIDTRTVTPTKRPPLGKRPEPKRKTKEFRLQVGKVTTEVVRNGFKYARDDGNSYHEPMVLLVKVQARTDQDVMVYFTHRLEFTRSTGLSNGDYYFKNETDFVRVTNLPAVTHTSASPEMFPNAIAFEHRATVNVLIKEGDKIHVVALCEEKKSSRGNVYLQLTRVNLKRG